jgi:multicomponent Na+:H+ antiporter subunit C
MIEFFAGHLNYAAAALVFCAGLVMVITDRHPIRRLVGLALFQTSVGLFFISIGKVAGGTAAIRVEPGSRTQERLAGAVPADVMDAAGIDGVLYSNPLPHVLILTAIVVGVATLAVGLAIAIRISETDRPASSPGHRQEGPG